MTATRFRARPVEVDAVQLTWLNWGNLCELIGPFTNGLHGVYVDQLGNARDDYPGDQTDDQPARIGLLIPMGGGQVLAVEGDWILRGADGQLRPCKPAQFAETWEPATEVEEQAS